MGTIYSKAKVLHYRDALDRLARNVEGICPPIHIRIKPTNACNQRCWYCSYRLKGVQLGQDMDERDVIPRDKMMEIVDDMIAMGVRAVTFSGGGEPFCYPHLEETALRLAQGGVRFASLTNGSRLSGSAAEVFAHRATWLRVSIDGWDDESYARQRRVAVGEFTRVLANMRAFKRLNGPCHLGAALVVDHAVAPHVAELIQRVCEAGVDSVKVAPCIISNVAGENNEYHAPIFDEVKRQIALARERVGDGRVEVFDSYHLQLETFEKSYRWCPYLQLNPVIGADLNVYACHDKAYNLEGGLLGSLRNRRFCEFWMDGKDKFFRIDPSRHCNHHCVANQRNILVHEYLDADTDHLAFV